MDHEVLAVEPLGCGGIVTHASGLGFRIYQGLPWSGLRLGRRQFGGVSQKLGPKRPHEHKDLTFWSQGPI